MNIFLKLLLVVCIISACKKKNFIKKSTTVSDFQFSVPVLSKGINLSNWFNDYSDPAQYNNRFTRTSFQSIRQLGFTYVRIPVGAEILFNRSIPSQLNTANLVMVDAAVKTAVDAGLGVTINLHPWTNELDSLLASDPSAISKVSAYWKAIANYFKKYPADKLFFEVYNEPHASASGLTPQPKTWWQPVQEQMILAIRQETAEHYVIAGGEGWNSIEGLLLLSPYNIQKLIYNFHFYDPFLFTHQGAIWAGWDAAIYARNVPYPSSPAAVAPVIAQTGNQLVKDALNWYGGANYTIDSLNKWVKRAADWATQNKVLLICNEFGSYKPFAPRQSRLAYIKDIRMVLEQNKIGWSMWEYDEGFGLIDYNGGDRNNPAIDVELATALGLQ